MISIFKQEAINDKLKNESGFEFIEKNFLNN